MDIDLQSRQATLDAALPYWRIWHPGAVAADNGKVLFFGGHIVDVASNEPENGLGDGDHAPDWQATGPLSLTLRAERSGIGDGRTYTITVRCTDAPGNTSTATTTVVVPVSMKNK